VNEQAAQLARWLLAANGALKNVAQLLVESFAPQPVAAATIDPTTITAYPVDPAAAPVGGHWARTPNAWAHPLHSTLLPRSTSAAHYVLAGVTSRNELLLINLAAAGYLGVEGADPIPLMRSWLMQVLSTTPEASDAVDDPDLVIPGTPRLTLVAGPAAAPPSATVLFASGHTSGPAAPITVSGQAAGAANVVLCSGAAAGIYIANRYWPMWRRMELSEKQWAPLASTLTATLLTSGDDTSPEPEEIEKPWGAAPVAVGQPATETPSTSSDDTSPGLEEEVAAPEVAEAPAAPETLAPPELPAPHDIPAEAGALQPPHGGDATAPAEQSPPARLEEPALSAPSAMIATSPADDVFDLDEGEPPAPGAIPELPGAPAMAEPPQRGLFALGETYALGVDPDTGKPVKHPAVTRQGVRKPIKALMMLATSSGLTTAEWDRELQFNPPNRRQARTTIRKLMGGDDPIREDSRGLLVTDLYCDWREFQRLAGPAPAQATTENLLAAVALIRGAPFEDIPPGDYGWRSVELLKDELLDRCSDAALELARRQHAAGALTSAYQTARLGIRVYPQREDLWEVALATATDGDKAGLLYDLKQAIPAPKTPELRQLLAEARTR
jgi:hypothetical protein